MIYLVALLAGVGGAFIGAAVGLGPFALLFELLRELDRDAALNSKAALAGFSLSFAAFGFITGSTLAWRWRGTAETAPPRWKALTVAVLASAGATALVFLADVTGLIGRMVQLIEHGEVLLIFVTASVLALIAGAMLAVLTLGRAASWKARIAITAIAIFGGFAIIIGGLMADKRFNRHYPGLGSDTREALVEIRMPPEMYRDESALRVALRTPTGTTPARENYWFRDAGHVTMRTRVNMSERTRERTLVISFDGRPEVTVPMHVPSNPRVMLDYGPWRPLGPDGVMAIRILTR